MQKRQVVFALILFVIVMVFGASALAAETEEYGAKYLMSDDPALIDVDIIDFKVRLNELGFYSAGVSENTLQTRELDDLTMAAVKLVCTYNPDLEYYADGVSNVLYWRVMGMVDEVLKTPLDEAYRALSPGEESDAIAQVQNRLNQLGYDAAGYTFVPGVYDDALQGAVDAFVQRNKFVYEREEGITPELQELLFSDGALAYEAEGAAPMSFSARIFAFLTSSGDVLGIRLPNAVLLLIGFALLCVIVILILKLFSQDGGDSPMKKGGGEIVFQVEYEGDQYVHRASSKSYVRIGRSTGDFPLNMADESVSRKHCEIYPEKGQLMLRDFSSYGTVVNGTLCHHSQQVLHSGDVIEIGRHKITIQFRK